MNVYKVEWLSKGRGTLEEDVEATTVTAARNKVRKRKRIPKDAPIRVILLSRNARLGRYGIIKEKTLKAMKRVRRTRQ